MVVTTGHVPKQPVVYRCEMDAEGFILLPVQVQQALGLQAGHRVDLQVLGDRVQMSHAWPCCRLCGGSRKLRIVRPSFLCEDCLERIRALDPDTPPLPEDVGLREG